MSIKHNLKTNYFENKEFQKEVIYLEEETLYGYAWNKAYNIEYLKQNNLQFRDIKHIEDIEFNVRCFDNITKLNILEDILYHYVQHGGERLTSKKIENYFELQRKRIKIIKKQQENWNVYDEKSKQILAMVYFRSFYSMLARDIHNKPKKEMKNAIKSEFDSSLYNEFRKHFKAKKITAKLLYFPITHKNYTITLLYAKIIYVIKNKCGFVFSKLKQIRK